MDFSIKHTNQAKGIALILLLIHHLFFQPYGNFQEIMIGNTPIFYTFGEFAKLCVGIFVFLSGYGLYKSFSNKKIGFKKYIKGHFIKIYMNYWLMWLLFVPVGVLVFGRTLDSVYGVNYVVKLIEDIAGVQNIFNFGSYNPAWWFIPCIIILYLLFPLLYTLINKFKALFVAFILFLSLMSVDISFCGLQPYEPIRDYLLTFVLGMFVAQNKLIEKLDLLKIKTRYKILLSIVSLLVVIFIRFHLNTKALILTDGIITFILCYFVLLINSQWKIMSTIGEHSFNIYLFHTLIYAFYIPKIIYFFKYPILITLMFLLICILISMFIEFMKNKLCFYKLQERMIK